MFNFDITEVTRGTGIGKVFWLLVMYSGVRELLPHDRLQVYDHWKHFLFRDDLRAHADY